MSSAKGALIGTQLPAVQTLFAEFMVTRGLHQLFFLVANRAITLRGFGFGGHLHGPLLLAGLAEMLVAQTVSVGVKSNTPFALQTLLGQSRALCRRGRHCCECDWGVTKLMCNSNTFFDNLFNYK